jgi:hypothetical protein
MVVSPRFEPVFFGDKPEMVAPPLETERQVDDLVVSGFHILK